MRASISHLSITVAYQNLLKAGSIRPDAAQAMVVGHLDALLDRVKNPPSPMAPLSFWSRIFGAPASQAPNSLPTSMYIHGAVGGGKTFLMDLFYQESPSPKHRTHFADFMGEVHRGIHQWRAGQRHGDPLNAAAQRISQRSRILCFDEFQVTDVADALILSRLFRQLWQDGMCVVATSNRPPEDLYEDGLQRHLFLPFIDLLRQQSQVLSLSTHCDYRRGLELDGQCYFPLGPRLRQVWQDLVSEPVQPLDLPVPGTQRRWHLSETTSQAVWLTFEDTCAGPHGTADYIALSQAFRQVFLSGVPRLCLRQATSARRFIHLIDQAYNAQCQLFLSAAEPLEALFQLEGPGQSRPWFDDLSGDYLGNIQVGREESFMFRRTVSRLLEMQSKAWHEQAKMKRT